MTGQNVQPINMDAVTAAANNASGNNNKGRDNYFQTSIKKYGPNFHHSKPLKQLQYDAKHRLFRDMVDNRINYDEFGGYFTDPQYLDNLIAVAQSLQNEHAIIADSLFDFATKYQNPVAAQLNNRHRNIAAAFGVIAGQLIAVKSTGYNIQYLSMIAPSCVAYRNDFFELY